jgi:hypothetical protein
LIGFWCDGTFSQIIFDPVLQPAAETKGLSVEEPKQFMQYLLKRSIDENRRIIAYTQHEKNTSKFYFGVDLSPVYADARMIAVKWLNRIKRKHVNWKKEHPSWNIDRGLKNFFELMGYYRPLHLGKEKTTKRIRDVRNMLTKRNGDYEQLTGTAKRKWTNLLKHNQHDVIGMRTLMEKALSDYVPR